MTKNKIKTYFICPKCCFHNMYPFITFTFHNVSIKLAYEKNPGQNSFKLLIKKKKSSTIWFQIIETWKHF